ncbi:hypothetical protein K488DRAFT_50135, partial [Vararia minispora EC-137]
LSPQDLASLACCCKITNAGVKEYYARVMGIQRILRPVFDSPESFRIMQSETGTLVSGSAALQLFERTTYQNSDLDMYVEYRHAQRVVVFLQKNDYVFKSRGRQDASSVTTVSDSAMDTVFGRCLGRRIADVLDFVRGEKKVQLVVAKKASLDIILFYHSTCVMNVISHRRAYSLFPRATFINWHSLATRQKHLERGWKMVDIRSTSVFDTFLYTPDFTLSKRWIGDPATWMINLSPALPDLGEDAISTNSFSPNIVVWCYSFVRLHSKQAPTIYLHPRPKGV